MSRLVFGFIYLLHFFPPAIIAFTGNCVGAVAYWLIRERRQVIRINLALCFPQKPARERERLARAHFRAFCRSFLERGILWWGSRRRIERLVRLEGREHLEQLKGRPVILFAPHFLGLDAALTRLTCDYPLAVMFGRQKDPLFDALMTRGRTRFGGRAFSRQEGIRAGFKAMKQGSFFYYLPDMDFGAGRALFVPFFGVPAATVTGLSDIARLAGAAVLPCVTRMLPGGAGYVATIHPPWRDFPGGEDAAARFADTRRMLAFIEERVREMPEQYYWIHKRFKTRPAGEPKVYP